MRYDDFKASTDNNAHRTVVLAGAFIDLARNSSFAITYQDDVGHSEIAPIPAKTMWQLNWQITF